MSGKDFFAMLFCLALVYFGFSLNLDDFTFETWPSGALVSFGIVEFLVVMFFITGLVHILGDAFDVID